MAAGSIVGHVTGLIQPGVGAAGASRSASTRPADGPGFGHELTSTFAIAAAPNGVSPASPSPPIVMLQRLAADDAIRRDRDSRRRAGDVLVLLTELQRCLLDDADQATDDALRRLAASLLELGSPADPALAIAVNNVELRARVELARRGY